MKNNRVKNLKPNLLQNGEFKGSEPNKPVRFLTKENIRRRYEHI